MTRILYPFICLILLFLSVDYHSYASEGEPQKKKKNKAKVAFVETNYYKLNAKKKEVAAIAPTKEEISSLAGDPLRFSINSDKSSVQPGEKFEIKIVVQFIPVSPSQYFTFEELKGYSLKLIVPNGFIRTGGSFYDNVSDELSISKNTKVYTLQGYFEGGEDTQLFKLLRSRKESNSQDIFVLKSTLGITILRDGEKLSTIPKIENLSRFRLAAIPNESLATALLCDTEPYTVLGSTLNQGKYSTLSSTYAQSWYILNVTKPGKMRLQISSVTPNTTNPKDVDFICYGPFENTTIAAIKGLVDNHNRDQNGTIINPDNPVLAENDIKSQRIQDESFDGSSIEWVNFGYDQTKGGSKGVKQDAKRGYYVLMVSNFSNTDARITFTQQMVDGIEINCGTTTTTPPDPCLSLSTPVASVNPQSITTGESFQLSTSSCPGGELSWLKNGVTISGEFRDSWTTSSIATYVAKCTYTNCNNTIKTSNSVTPSLVPLRINHNLSSTEILANQQIQLTAIGCTNGIIEWKLPNNTFISPTNPITVTGAGTYQARCVSKLDPTVASSYVSVSFTLKAANKPVITKSTNECIYDNRTINITAECPSGMTLQWWDGGNAPSNPNTKTVYPGSYQARCCNGTCSAWETVQICTKNPGLVVVSSNKTDPTTGLIYANPTEPVVLTGSGCESGTVNWDDKGQLGWGSSITVYGPGRYKARCYVTDNSIGSWTFIEILPKAPGSVTIIPNKIEVATNEPITLNSDGCPNGFVVWEYVSAGVTFRETGKSIDAVGPNTYKAWCVSFGVTGPPSSVIIPQSYGKPTIFYDKSKVKSNETFTYKADFSTCYNPWQGGWVQVTQNGTTQTFFETVKTITGPAKLKAICGDAAWNTKEAEVFLAEGDQLKLVANKNNVKASPAEAVLLTTYGCDYGYIEWKIGNTIITGSPADPKRQLTQYGPGYYKARCRDDFSINTDWVTIFVAPNGSITPAINGPQKMCPNSPVTITSTGCPSGYYNSWYRLENDWLNWGSSVSISTPQTVRYRCVKNDESFASEEKTLTVEPAFPDVLKAKNTGPAVLGGSVQITVTDVIGATYLWTPPAGVTLSNAAVRTIPLASVNESHVGTYKVKVTFGTCSVDVSTNLQVNACENLYISAINPTTGLETNRLTRKPNVAAKNEYDPLILQAQTLDGQVNKALNYTWNGPVTLTPTPTDPYKVQVNKMGHYTVQVSSAGGISCLLEVDIFAEPCNVIGDYVNCGAPCTNCTNNSDAANISSLAVGDQFTTKDYTITVLEVTGSQAAGWTGKGSLKFNFLKLGSTAIQIPIAVKFDNIKVNQCYQLLPGSTVITEYDPSWGSIANLGLGEPDIASELIARMISIQDDIVARMDAFTGSVADSDFLNARIVQLNTLRTDITNSTFDAEIKSTLIEQVDALISYTSCSANPANTQGARVEAMQAICSLNPWVALAKCLGSASLDIFGSYVFKWVELKLNDTPKAFSDFSGITNSMDWAATLSSAGVSCVFSVVPIPSGKTAIAAMVGASGIAASEAFSSNILTQYSSLRNTYSSPKAVFDHINWSQAFSAAGGAGSITFISTALIRAGSHATVLSLKNKIIKIAQNKGGAFVRTQLKSLGFADDFIDQVFVKWGIKGDFARSLLPKTKSVFKDRFGSADFTNADILPITITAQAGKSFAQSAEDLISDLFKSKGMQKMESKIGGDNGFDILLVDNLTNPKQVIIIEVKSSTSSASHSASMNSPVNACIESGEKQMSWCWVRDVVRRMKDATSKPTIQSNANKIATIINNQKAERYVVSVNSVGEAKILSL